MQQEYCKIAGKLLRGDLVDNVPGILTLNLEPPYLSFQPRQGSSKDASAWHCTSADLSCILLDLGLDTNQLQSWPPKELVIRWEGSFPGGTLSKFGLLPIRI